MGVLKQILMYSYCPRWVKEITNSLRCQVLIVLDSDPRSANAGVWCTMFFIYMTYTLLALHVEECTVSGLLLGFTQVCWTNPEQNPSPRYRVCSRLLVLQASTTPMSFWSNRLIFIGILLHFFSFPAFSLLLFIFATFSHSYCYKTGVIPLWNKSQGFTWERGNTFV